MLKAALDLFLLRRLPWPCFGFPRWQSVAVITLIGVLTGLDPSQQIAPSPLPGILFSLLAIWLAFALNLFFMKWWMRRDGRWDGQGDLFNLLAASWAVVDIIGAGLMVFGVPQLLLLPLWAYSLWVATNALCGAIAKASFGYTLGGVLLAIILIIVAMLPLGVAYGVVLAMLGIIDLPAA